VQVPVKASAKSVAACVLAVPSPVIFVLAMLLIETSVRTAPELSTAVNSAPKFSVARCVSALPALATVW
jgi:hypothetical protein